MQARLGFLERCLGLPHSELQVHTVNDPNKIVVQYVQLNEPSSLTSPIIDLDEAALDSGWSVFPANMQGSRCVVSPSCCASTSSATLLSRCYITTLVFSHSSRPQRFLLLQRRVLREMRLNTVSSSGHALPLLRPPTLCIKNQATCN